MTLLGRKNIYCRVQCSISDHEHHFSFFFLNMKSWYYSCTPARKLLSRCDESQSQPTRSADLASFKISAEFYNEGGRGSLFVSTNKD